MTERAREISLSVLAGKLAEGDKGLKNEWTRQLREAVTTGTLEAIKVLTPAHGLSRRPSNPMGASREWLREFAPPEQARQPVTLVDYRFIPAAVAAWLLRVGIEPPGVLRAWLGDAWQTAAPESDSKGPEKGDEIPGILPSRAAGKLAIKAAWQIECETKRRASDKEVMARLHEWAKKGSEPAILIQALPAKRAVKWLTAKGEEREFTLEACEKALGKWHESRQ